MLHIFYLPKWGDPQQKTAREFDDIFLFLLSQKFEGPGRMFGIQVLEKLHRAFAVAVGEVGDVPGRQFVQLHEVRDLVMLKQVFDIVEIEHDQK